MTEHEVKWRERKARMDACDDGYGPGAYFSGDSATALWPEFLAWANDNLGQGYSLACCDGVILDNTTFWCWKGYLAGRNKSKEEDAQGNRSLEGR